MPILDWLTFAIAIYGAIVATLLGIREIRREEKKVALFFILHEWEGAYSINVTNIAHRPITIIDMLLSVGGETIPKNILEFGEVEQIIFEWPLPVTLTDGQFVTIRIPYNISRLISDQDKKVEIIVYDAEGKTYSEYKRLSYSSKYGAILPR